MSVVLRRGFKAYKQIVKVQYRLGNTEAMLDAYRWVGMLGEWSAARALAQGRG
jgi:hypothetical protein